MDRFSVFAPKLLPTEESFVSALRSCPGCGQALAVRLIGKALGHTNRYPYGPAQHEVDTAGFPYARWNYFASEKLTRASAVINADKMKAVAIESGAFKDIAPLVREAAHKGRKLFTICFFNEAGIERHDDGPVPGYCHDTIKTFSERLDSMRGVLETARSFKPDFFATACPAYPFDLIEKVQKGLACGGTGFLAVFAPCPTGCLYDPATSLQSGKLAVQTGFFPLYQISGNGNRTTMTVVPRKVIPVAAYMKLQQGYIITGQDEVSAVQGMVDRQMQRIKAGA